MTQAQPALLALFLTIATATNAPPVIFTQHTFFQNDEAVSNACDD